MSNDAETLEDVTLQPAEPYAFSESESKRPIWVIVMAAGQGKRMGSDLPKPLVPLLGKPMLSYVLDAFLPLEVEQVCVVVGHKAETVEEYVRQNHQEFNLSFALQENQRGTGDAVKVALETLPQLQAQETQRGESLIDPIVVVIAADMPTVSSELLANLLEKHKNSKTAATVTSVERDDPFGYGRLIRDADQSGPVQRIVEERDATEEQKKINEVNAGLYCFSHELLKPALERITPENAQGEYYLTDVIEVLAELGFDIDSFVASSLETQGVNSPVELQRAQEFERSKLLRKLVESGVKLTEPWMCSIDATVKVEPGAIIEAGTVLRGTTVIKANALIGPNTYLHNAEIGEGAVVQCASVIGATVEANERVEPHTSRRQ